MAPDRISHLGDSSIKRHYKRSCKGYVKAQGFIIYM